jgi:PAS domain S-box-containing protein
MSSIKKKQQLPERHPSDTPKEWLQHIFEHSPALVYMTDNKGTFLDINEAGAKMLGATSRSDLVGKVSAVTLYANQKDRSLFQHILRKKGFVPDFETCFRRLDKSLFEVRITAATRRDDNGKVIGFEGFITDITDKKKTEETLRESEETYRTIVENSLAGLSIHQNGRNQFVNRRYAEMLGFDDPGYLVGRHFWEFIHPEDRAMVRQRGLLREKEQFLPNQYVVRFLKKDKKSFFWAEMQATHATYMGMPAAVANFVDISAGKRAEEEIRNLSRRLVEVREEERKMMAMDLHDQMGQRLTAIYFELEMLQKMLLPNDIEQKVRTERLISSVAELADKVRKNITYLRPDILNFTVLAPVLERLIHEFKDRHPEIQVNFQALGLKRRLNPEIELVLFRTVQESLTNIAKHANATSVEVICTYNHPTVIIIIRDNGIGYSPMTKSSKNNPDRGLGLLSMKERIVSYGGKFDITSKPGKGTTIRAEIPA